MIAFVKGKVVSQSEDGVVVDIGNIGVNVRVTERMLSMLLDFGEEIVLHTYTHVKEDAFMLYGFELPSELAMFRQLLTVNGIGPKGALAIMSLLPVQELQIAIATGDSKTIAKANGVGAKTAQRLILELKDKIVLDEVLESMGSDETNLQTSGKLSAQKQDAVEALVALGYSQSEATKAVKQVPVTEQDDADSILKGALRFLF